MVFYIDKLDVKRKELCVEYVACPAGRYLCCMSYRLLYILHVLHEVVYVACPPGHCICCMSSRTLYLLNLP